MNEQEEKIEKKCICNDKECAKCLIVNCQDDNCSTHPIEKKTEFRERYKNR